MLPPFVIQEVAKRIAGEIALADEPGRAMKKWREIFEVTQTEVSKVMSVAPSVISDYEKGKRVPGSKFIKRYVNALLEIDHMRGWRVTRLLAQRFFGISAQAIDLWEYKRAVTFEEILTATKGYLLNSTFKPTETVYGYLVMDSLKTIEELDAKDFTVLMGMSYKKVVVFTRVGTGRPPMVAIRVSYWKPSLVVLHKPVMLDRLSVRIAEKEGIPVIVSLADSVSDLIDALRSLDSR
ncbi:XRE family transcriptional regulator [Ignicoccus pacificus DSM 13166]|uniref:XRE family transcriptional regulator n=1 Tax=Ignicoccus pacificus DSM 13166 TaxID=940294 RepID=A0A977K8U6_9CREN|nr:XRE family transcriptional regulator [Ignicoccus pacificus DSM 13166]